ncbi:hypothetical protein Tco_1080073 [Tanacetum coccineum]|uniref:Uncharacterized protein n=1 Tax=Tanacetum coccineum TaxID=301880 RepID=A0ABQ5HTQ1_9ASTR
MSTIRWSQFLAKKLDELVLQRNKTERRVYAEARIFILLSASCAQVLWMADKINGLMAFTSTRFQSIEHVEKGTIELVFVQDDYQRADPTPNSSECIDPYLVCRLGMRSLSPQELERLAKSR